MKKVLLFLIPLFLIISILILTYFLVVKSVPVKFTSIHPRIAVTKNEFISFNLYANVILDIKNKIIWGVKPKVIGIFYTDKIRPENPDTIDNYTQDLGATIDVVNENEVLIYIYVSENIIVKNGAKKIIREYTIDTIKYYQGSEKNKIENLFSKLVELPINVKNN